MIDIIKIKTAILRSMTVKYIFSSKEAKALLSLSDCQLMHEREAGKLKFVKKGNKYLYNIDDLTLVSNHKIANQIINWHHKKHKVDLNNFPQQTESVEAIALLLRELLIPIYNKFGDLTVTYGFVSCKLNTFIQRNNRSGTYPSIDQHSGHELNSKGVTICERGGVASDIYVAGYKQRMNEVVNFIVNDLEFDKIYYYGKNRPIHLSVSKQMLKHLQIMKMSDKGRRVPGRKAFGEDAITLAKELT